MKAKEKKTAGKVPHTLVILFFLVLIMSLLTWIIPPGQFQYEEVDVNGTMRNLVVPGSFEYIARDTVEKIGIMDFLTSFHKGLITASEIVMLIFMVNGCFSIVIRSGSINALLGSLLRKFNGKEKIIVPLFFVIFALGSSFFGMLNEYNGLIPIFVGLGIAMGYDAIVGMAMISLGAYIGFAGSIMNPYTVVVAQSIAGIPLYSNSLFRAICFAIFCTVSILWIFRYMNKIKKDPSASYMNGEKSEYSFDLEMLTEFNMTKTHKIILGIIFACLGLILWGSINKGWGAIELTGVFLLMGISSGIVDGLSADDIANQFIEGCKGVVFGALTTGIAMAALVIMREGMIIDTIINFLASGLQRFPTIISAYGMLFVQTLINFIIPSGSGQAATVVPIFAPIGDLVGLSREVVVLAFQFGDGFSNLLWPTCGVTVACGLAGVSIDKWWKFYIPLFGILFLIQMAILTVAVLIGI